jgi:hypothetical protein
VLLYIAFLAEEMDFGLSERPHPWQFQKMNAAALFKQIIALRPRLKAPTKEWDDTKAAGAEVAIMHIDSNGQPLPTISVTPPPTASQFGSGSTSKNNGNGVDNLRANYVLGVGAKRNGDLDLQIVWQNLKTVPLLGVLFASFACCVLTYDVRAQGPPKNNRHSPVTSRGVARF